MSSPADRALQNRRVWLAPICLCVVAGLHAWRVMSAGQTPWKGGGFGMFSTIDAEHARYVRAYLVTPTGERPLILPTEFDRKIAELRAAPNREGLEALAQKLSQKNWHDSRLAQRELTRDLTASSKGGKPLSVAQLANLRAKAVEAAATSADTTPVAVLAAEHAPHGLPFTEVRCELWKYELPAGTSLLQGRRLFTASAMREAGQP